MACDITRGRLIDCKDTIGGLKAIYICKNYNNNISAVATVNATELTSAGFKQIFTFIPLCRPTPSSWIGSFMVFCKFCCIVKCIQQSLKLMEDNLCY